MGSYRFRSVDKGLIEGSLNRSVLRLSWSLIAGALLQDLFSIVDLYFVGQLGSIPLAALAMAGTVTSVLVMVIMGITIGATALVAQFTGSSDMDKADMVLGQTIILCLLASAGMVAVGLWGTEPLLRLFGATGDVMTQAAEYIRIVFCWAGTIFVFFGVSQALRGAGDTKTPLYVLVGANIINIALDPVLIMGYLGAPAMGVAGSAAATVISRAVGMVVLLGYLFLPRSILHLRLRNFVPHMTIIGRITRMGFFASMEVLMREVSFLLLMRLVSSFGPAVLAAYGIGSRLRMVVMMPGFGFGNASSVLLGQHLGAGKTDRGVAAVWRALSFYQVLVIPVAFIYILAAFRIVGVFADDPAVIEHAVTFLRYLSATLPFLAVCIIMARAITGSGDTRAPFIMSGIGMLGIRIPAAYIFAHFWGPVGIWLGINVSDILYALMLALYFKSRRWEKVFLRHREVMNGLQIDSGDMVDMASPSVEKHQ